MIRSAAFFLVMLLILWGPGCASNEATSGCLSCHSAIEPVSGTHTDCVACHGGDPRANDKVVAHRMMLGGRNPSAPDVWGQSCGRCHPSQLQRVAAGLMMTNRGIVEALARQGKDSSFGYSNREQEVFDAEGKPVQLRGAAELQEPYGALYRKNCARCHLGSQSSAAYRIHHDAGCAACHFPFNETGTYEGKDGSVRGKHPYSASHDMEALPGTRVCLRCHNQSGRSGLYYLGFNDATNVQVPTRAGLPGPRLGAGGRTLSAISLDVHAEAGLQCIDCHTSREVMGDGYSYRSMNQQAEVTCQDCHGSGSRAPRFAEIIRENELPVRESRSYALQMGPGVLMALTSKGNKFSNVFLRGRKVYTLGKRSGKLHETKVITGSAEHTVVGHSRLACTSCHSRTVGQNHGAEMAYVQNQSSFDFLAGKLTPGAFHESGGYRSFYPFPLALDRQGRVSPVRLNARKLLLADNGGGTPVAVEEGLVAYNSHNAGKSAIGCSECHAEPAFLGFGQVVSGGGELEPTMIEQDSSGDPLGGFVSLQEGRVASSLPVEADLPRPLDTREVRRVLAVNQCLVCHEKSDDPIYQKPLDYSRLDDCLRQLPAAER